MCFSQVVFCQLPTEKDLKRLTIETHKRINRCRNELGLSILKYDTILQKAAQNQINFNFSTKDLSHFQPDPKYKTVLNRIESAGGKFRIADEIHHAAWYPRSDVTLHRTMAQYAEDIFSYIKIVKRDFGILTNPTYTSMGIGLIIGDSTSKSINIVLVFAAEMDTIQKLFSSDTYSVKPSSVECQNLMISENALTTVGNSITVENGKVVLTYHNIEHIKEIFSGPNDGIAVDLLGLSQFACGIGNRTNPSPICEGFLLPPVYRDALLKSNRAQNQNRFISTIGTIPEKMKDQTLVPAIIIIKNGTACHWSSPIQIPHKTFAPIPYELQTNVEATTPFIEKGIISSKQIFFQFQRNITTTKIHDPIPAYNNSVHSIEITSYSSIEGDSAKNEVLHTKRAEFMRSEILKKNSTSKITIEAKENWEKCLMQLEMLGKEKLSKLSHDSIRKVLLLDKKNNWDSLYYAQRRSHATIYYIGSIDKSDTKNFLSMNLQTALIEKNVKLANKALDSLYRTKLFCPLLLEENIITMLMEYPSLVANACAVLSITSNFQSEQLIRYVRHWLLNSQNLDPLAKQNLIYLYARTSKQLLNKWDVETSKLAKVLHPLRAEFVLTNIQKTCPTIIQLDFNIGTIEYYTQINDYKSIKPKFEYIESFFKKQTLSMKELEELILFYNHWGRFDLTLQTLYREIDNPEFSVNCAYILAKTASAGQLRKTRGIDYMKIMKRAYEKDPIQFCNWISSAFNLLTDPKLKELYCQNCGKK